MIFVHLVIGVALLEFLYFGFAVAGTREIRRKGTGDDRK